MDVRRGCSRSCRLSAVFFLREVRAGAAFPFDTATTGAVFSSFISKFSMSVGRHVLGGVDLQAVIARAFSSMPCAATYLRRHVTASVGRP
eukprot:2369515-Pyramimonas_sp.AAC.1